MLHKMEEHSRNDVIKMIQSLTDLLNTKLGRLAEIDNALKDTTKISDDEALELISEKEVVEEDIDEVERDIGVYQEILTIMDMRDITDERSCSPYEEHYDSWEEVFTGGDY